MLTYPGVLMWEELLEEFADRYHCPTAVRIEVLDYVETDAIKAGKMGLKLQTSEGWKVQMVIVGDPTRGGALVNSPFKTGAKANCKMSTCQPNDLNLYLKQAEKHGPHRRIVNEEIVAIWSKGNVINKETELLMLYDDAAHSHDAGAFWPTMQQPFHQYCDQCFLKTFNTDLNPMFLCSERGCSQGRHKRCFELGDDQFSHSNWWCPWHRSDKPMSADIPFDPSLLKATPSPTQSHAASASSTVTTLSPPSSISPFNPSLLIATPSPPNNDLKDSSAGAVCSNVSLRHLTPHSLTAAINTCSTSSVAAAASSFKPSLELLRSTLKSSSRPSKLPTVDEEDIDDENHSLGRTQSAPSLSMNKRIVGRLSFNSRHKEASTQTTLNDRVLAELRSVWKAEKLKILKTNARAKWPSSPSQHEKEIDHHTKLLKQYDAICNCCVRRDKAITLTDKAQKAVAAIFLSPAAFLQEQLNFFGRFQYQRSSIDQHITAIIDQAEKQPVELRLYVWRHIPLCLNCFSHAVDRSRATLYRIAEKPDSDRGHTQQHVAHANVVQSVAYHLREYASDYGQPLPDSTSSGVGHQLTRVVLTTVSTITDCKEQIEKLMMANEPSFKPFSMSTFSRAIAYVKERNKLSIGMKKFKSVCRCNDCTTNEEELKAAMKKKDATAIAAVRAKMRGHLLEWTEQRQHFEEKKKLALFKPWYLNTCTLDGMDQTKTDLPHYRRESKLPNVQNKLDVRVVGAIYYGGPVPIMGFTSFADVPGKGGSASICILERILDLQWNAMDTSRWAEIPTVEDQVDNDDYHNNEIRWLDQQDSTPSSSAAAHASSSSASASFPFSSSTSASSPSSSPTSAVEACLGSNLNAEENVRPLEASDDPWIPPSDFNVDHIEDAPARTSKVPFMWPEGLHLTFDNTGADCKNKYFFRFLAALVGIGLFCWITVGNLLVGHTHDIVDQMFGVWARRLGNVDVKTLNQMHKLFRARYASKIYDLEKELKKEKSSVHKDLPPRIAKHLVDVAAELGIQPVLVLQTMVIECKDWCLPSTGYTLPNITVPHQFYIVKETIKENDDAVEREAVVMYNRFLSKSYNDPSVTHRSEYHNVRFGPWTTRTVLMEMKDVPLQDPYRKPPELIDTASVQSCLDDHHRIEKSMSAAEYEENVQMLKTFGENFEAFQAKCEECGSLMKELKTIGVISQRKDATPEQKRISSEQTKNKENVRERIRKHCNTPSHSHLIAVNWWTKWLDRINTVVIPYYTKRNLINLLTAEDVVGAGRRPHPLFLVSDKSEPPLQHKRVDRDCFNKNKQPQTGQFVVIRGGSAAEPIWVGFIVQVFDDESQAQQWQSEYKQQLALEDKTVAEPEVKNKSKNNKGENQPSTRGGKKRTAEASIAEASIAEASNLKQAEAIKSVKRTRKVANPPSPATASATFGSLDAFSTSSTSSAAAASSSSAAASSSSASASSSFSLSMVQSVSWNNAAAASSSSSSSSSNKRPFEASNSAPNSIEWKRAKYNLNKASDVEYSVARLKWYRIKWS